MADSSSRELSELAGKGPRRVVLHLASGDLDLCPPSLNALVDLERSGAAEGGMEYARLFLWHAAKRAGFAGTLEDFGDLVDFGDAEGMFEAVAALVPPPRSEVEAAVEKVVQATGPASAGN